MDRLQPLIGLAVIGIIAYSLSTNRKAIRLRTVAWGFGLQLVFAIFVLKTDHRLIDQRQAEARDLAERPLRVVAPVGAQDRDPKPQALT